MEENLLKIAKELNDILRKNDLSLINDFENAFTNLEYKSESSGMIIYGNRQLIRKAYFLIVMLYGEKASLMDFKELINNTNGQGRKMVMSFARIRNPQFYIQKESEAVISWFLNDYYSGMGGARGSTQTYIYTLPTRYLIEKMINILDIEKGLYCNIGKYIDNSIIEDEKDLKLEAIAQSINTNTNERKENSNDSIKQDRLNNSYMHEIYNDYIEEDYSDLI